MASHGDQADYFSTHSDLYSDPRIRPLYPPELFDKVFQFAGPATGAALDVATGSGQCAQQLATRYQQVWAIDASEEQIRQCKAHPRITFRRGCAEHTGLPDHSVDLVTVASALHWFDAPAFYAEARRVLQPQGALVGWSYYLPHIKGCQQADELLHTFWHGVLGPYKAVAHRHCEAQYSNLQPSQDDFAVVEHATVAFEQKSTVWHLVQFIKTTGLYGKMLKDKPGLPDPLQAFQTDLMSLLNASNVYLELTLQFSVFMILAKDPLPL